MSRDKVHRAPTVAMLADRTERQTKRPCPKSKMHKATGQVYVEFRLGDERRRIYLGAVDGDKWVSAYQRFAASWPEPLFDAPPPQPRPARRLIEHDGRSQTLTAWSREVGLKRSVLAYRLDVLGWSIRRAVTTPARVKAVCPRLQRDAKGNRAFVRWTHKKKRLTRFLGTWGSAEVDVGYAAFCERWAAGRV